jgi:Mg-chelatase subunit ChlD
VRYHEFKGQLSKQGQSESLRRVSASAILQRARAIVGSVVHLTEQSISALNEVPYEAEQVELDLDETLEASAAYLRTSQGNENSEPLLREPEIWVSYRVHKQQPIILSVDTSLSMTGEKLALTAVALAVVLLQFPNDPLGIVAFENVAKVLKQPWEQISVSQLVERFLDVPAQGYTHLEDGMQLALKLVKAIQRKSVGRLPATVLLTDGKYTAGKDPTYLATRFPRLVVLKMGEEQASQELCLDLARRGRGSFKQVSELEELPHVMYALLKDLLRGRVGGAS